MPFFFSCFGAARVLHSFPTRRSSDLSAGSAVGDESILVAGAHRRRGCSRLPRRWKLLAFQLRTRGVLSPCVCDSRQDRKSTRLNSSHSSISYAVFCLKKKKQPHLRSK